MRGRTAIYCGLPFLSIHPTTAINCIPPAKTRPQRPVMFSGHAGKLQRLLGNLIGNATHIHTVGADHAALFAAIVAAFEESCW